MNGSVRATRSSNGRLLKRSMAAWSDEGSSKSTSAPARAGPMNMPFAMPYLEGSAIAAR